MACSVFSVKSVQSSERKMLLLSGCQTQQTRPGWRVSPQHLARLIKCLDLHVNVCMKPCLPHLAVLPVSEENLRHFLPSRWRTANPPSEDSLTHTVHTLRPTALLCFGWTCEFEPFVFGAMFLFILGPDEVIYDDVPRKNSGSTTGVFI